MPELIGESFVRVRPDTTAFRLETQKGVQGALTGLGGLGALGSTLRFTGATAGVALLTLGTKEAITGAADLEQSLNVLEVTAGATAGEMEQIGREARNLGADLKLPGVSATDATTAMLELSKGGLDVQDTLGGARGVLQLAAAGALEVGEAAGIAAQALSTFRLPGEEAVRVADLLTGAAQSATGEVGDMALALSQAGAVASNANISIEDTVTAISLLAKNGLVGSDAGTSLRTTILRLIPATKEAAEIVDALGISISDSAGNLLPLGDIFDQYRQKLEGLTAVQQQQALTAIFGTDAIRAAAIFAREGAAGFDAMKGSVTEVGIAEKVTEARTEGLKGEFAGLQSNAETLATTLGGFVSPALEGVVEDINAVVSAANDGITALEGLGDVEIGGISAGDVAGAAQDFGSSLVPVIGPLQLLGDRVRFVADQIAGVFTEAEDSVSSFVTHAQSELADRGIIKFDIPAGFEAAEDNAHKAGRAVAKALADGIKSAEQEAVDAARQTLAEVIEAGNEAVAEAIRQGNEAVRLSAISAKQNLISIGTDLAGQAVALIDEGPLAQRIAALQATLGDTQRGNQRQRLRDTLSDAQRELEQAQGSIVTGPGPLSKAGQDAVDEFLDPFERAVRDAKAALGDFNTEGVISVLQEQADEQKKVVQKGIADLIVQFNQGTISLQALTVRTGALLRQAGIVPFGEAGKRWGVAVAENFKAQLEGLEKQAAEIARGIGVAQSGLEPDVISPAGEAARQGENVAATQEQAARNERNARQALVRAQLALKRAIDGDSGQGGLIAAINANTAALSGKGTAKGSDTRQPVPVSGR